MNLDVPEFDLPELEYCEPSSNNGEEVTIDDWSLGAHATSSEHRLPSAEMNSSNRGNRGKLKVG